MGNPRPSILFGIPLSSWDGKYYPRYYRGDLPGTPASASGSVPSASTSAPTATAAASGTDLPVIATEGFESYSAGASLPSNTLWYGVDADAPNSLRVQTTNPHTGSKSLEFKYSHPAGTAVCEQYFNLGAPKTEIDVEFYWWVPENYAHGPSSVSGSSATNNKFWRCYPVEYNDVPKFGASMLRQGSTKFSQLALEWDEHDKFSNGEWVGMTQRMIVNDWIAAADLGQWMKVRLYFKAATAKGTGKAIFKIWKNDVLFASATPDIYLAGANNYYQYGYILGATNAKYSQVTTFYIDDMIWKAK